MYLCGSQYPDGALGFSFGSIVGFGVFTNLILVAAASSLPIENCARASYGKCFIFVWVIFNLQSISLGSISFRENVFL